MQRRDELTSRGMQKIYSPPVISAPPIPKCRKSLRSESCPVNYNFQSSQMDGKISRRRTTSKQSQAETSVRDLSTSCDRQMIESSSEENEETHRSQNRSETISPRPQNRFTTVSPHCLQNHSTSPRYSQNCRQTISSGRNTSSENFEPESWKSFEEKIEQNTDNSFSLIAVIIIIVIGGLICYYISLLGKNRVHTQSVSNSALLLSESIEGIKAIFDNQESDIWNDISSAINEVVSRTPKIPSIILLFAKETTTMDCLATKLAQASSSILHGNDYLTFNPEDFGNDAGEIITTLKKHSPESKKVVIIRDILNINAEAIKALHNLCDRVNPLVAEAIYILTMRTNNYQSSQKKLSFVENQIYDKLSKSIDQDVLMALVTRITDGTIISVQFEPQLRYC